MKESTYKSIDALNKVAGIAVPVLIGAFGAILTIQKNQADEAKANLDRVTSTIQFLSSPQKEQRLFAVKVVSFLIKNRKYPSELQGAVLELAVNDNNAAVATAATNAAIDAAAADSTLEKQTQKAFSELPARIYFQIQDESQRAVAKKLATDISTSDIVIPGIELVANGPLHTELRYFRTADRADAEKFTQLMAASEQIKVTPKYVKGFANSEGIRSRHFELWMGAETSS